MPKIQNIVKSATKVGKEVLNSPNGGKAIEGTVVCLVVGIGYLALNKVSHLKVKAFNIELEADTKSNSDKQKNVHEITESFDDFNP